MSQATALKKAQQMKAVLLSRGVPEVSIELQQGRPVAGDRWDSLQIVTNFFHNTVSTYKPTSLTPVLALCKNGRSDLPGPLPNGYGGWDLCYRIITFGYANHPGEGGPILVPRNGGGSFRIPKDSARKYAWGTEFEGGIKTSDWDRVLTNPRTGDKMTFREFMGRCGAGIQAYFNLPLNAHLEHSTWTPRKGDRTGYTQVKGEAEIKKFSSPIAGGGTTKPPTKEEWFDMDQAAFEASLDKIVKKYVVADNNHDAQVMAWDAAAHAYAAKRFAEGADFAVVKDELFKTLAPLWASAK